MLYLVYTVIHKKTRAAYVGLTTSRFKTRVFEHKILALRGDDSQLSKSLRLHGFEAFDFGKMVYFEGVGARCRAYDAVLLFMKTLGTVEHGYNTQEEYDKAYNNALVYPPLPIYVYKDIKNRLNRINNIKYEPLPVVPYTKSRLKMDYQLLLRGKPRKFNGRTLVSKNQVFKPYDVDAVWDPPPPPPSTFRHTEESKAKISASLRRRGHRGSYEAH